MMCGICGKGELNQSTTNHIVDLGNSIIIIKNVPCLKCKHCEEVLYSDEVSTMIENLVAKSKIMLQELIVIDYNKAA